MSIKSKIATIGWYNDASQSNFSDATLHGFVDHLAALGYTGITYRFNVNVSKSGEVLNTYKQDKLDQIIAEFELPAHTVGLGVKGAMIWSPDPVRNYRDYKATDFETAELSWLWGVNRGVLTPPGLDEQWLVSLAHSQKDMDKMVASTRELAAALRA